MVSTLRRRRALALPSSVTTLGVSGLMATDTSQSERQKEENKQHQSRARRQCAQGKTKRQITCLVARRPAVPVPRWRPVSLQPRISEEPKREGRGSITNSPSSFFSSSSTLSSTLLISSRSRFKGGRWRLCKQPSDITKRKHSITKSQTL
jgi:hypothetical protein